jgi:hypothetical protein
MSAAAIAAASRAALEVDELADEMAIATGELFVVWKDAVTAAGGAERARWLIREMRLPAHRLTPEALLLAHTVATLLDVGPTPPRTGPPT